MDNGEPEGSCGRGKWWSVAVLVPLLVIAAGVLLEGRRNVGSNATLTIKMSIAQIAPELDVTKRALASELDLPLEVSKKKPIGDLGVSQDQLDHATSHLLSHRPSMVKYYLFGAISLFALIYLTRLGIVGDRDKNGRGLRYSRVPYLVVLVFAVVVCGFALGKSPNPMEGAVKTFKAMVGLYPSVSAKALALAFFLLLAIVGNKIVCGWACPFGALQELVYSVPMPRVIRSRKIPFWLSNTIRLTLFVSMLLFLLGVIGNKKGFVLYHSINPFNLFNWDFDAWMIGATVTVVLILAIPFYRPYCYLICPFGLLSWIVERASLARIRIDLSKCTKCKKCISACPSDAVQGILDGKRFAADCMSCARCLDVCPHGLIRYGVSNGPSPASKENGAEPATDR